MKINLILISIILWLTGLQARAQCKKCYVAQKVTYCRYVGGAECSATGMVGGGGSNPQRQTADVYLALAFEYLDAAEVAKLRNQLSAESRQFIDDNQMVVKNMARNIDLQVKKPAKLNPEKNTRIQPQFRKNPGR